MRSTCGFSKRMPYKYSLAHSRAYLRDLPLNVSLPLLSCNDRQAAAAAAAAALAPNQCLSAPLSLYLPVLPVRKLTSRSHTHTHTHTQAQHTIETRAGSQWQPVGRPPLASAAHRWVAAQIEVISIAIIVIIIIIIIHLSHHRTPLTSA